MITPRATRLVRVPDLRAFRHAVCALACEGEPLAARDRLVIVPTRAAAAQLTRSIEARRLPGSGAVLLPDLVTRDELYARLAARLPERPRLLNPFEREALAGVACREAASAGTEPPFRLRPGLIAEILAFYDDLRRNEHDVEAFARKTLGALEPGADADRGAERLVRQTRFLVAAFRRFEERCAATGALDEHTLRARLRETPADTPWRHAVVTVRDRATDSYGLWACDFDLLARLPGLTRIDLVVTDTCLAGTLHERVHRLFPGIVEERWPLSDERSDAPPRERHPMLVLPPATGVAHVARDREEEVADFAVRARRLAKDPGAPLDRMALVVRRPLPYVYLAREVLRSASVSCQMADALPLAAEPYAAALDLVFACVSANFARSALVAMLRSPHLCFERQSRRLDARDLMVLDRALSEAGYLGELAALESLVSAWSDRDGRIGEHLAAAGAIALDAARALSPLREPRPLHEHLDVLLAFLHRHDAIPGPDDPLRVRQLRARAAILSSLHGIRAAHAACDSTPGELETLTAIVRRWIESQTFAPRTGESGVHLVDADSARYGDFDFVQLAGMVDGEWPERPVRSIFYSPAVLHELGWPPERARIEGARDAFVDLLRLPARWIVTSAFTLENDTMVSASPFLDAVEAAGLETMVEEAGVRPRVFEWEALGLEPVRPDRAPAAAAAWVRFRIDATPVRDPRHRGATSGHAAAAFSLSALERYLDCPFKFFAADVLRLEEAPEDEPTLSPRARGRFIHEVFQRFFEAWDRLGAGTITPERYDQARALFDEVAGPLLARLPDAEAALERTRLFGSAIAVGIVDVVLGIEASRSLPVVERWLEHRLEGDFSLGAADGRRAPLRGVADRIDVLEGRRLRVIDYKSGYAPDVKRALQVPVYALCASERLADRGGEPWTVDEAAYVAFSGKRALVPVVKAGSANPAGTLDAARGRLFEVLDAVARGEFAPRPHDPTICAWCAYPSVCRKDYVGDE